MSVIKKALIRAAVVVFAGAVSLSPAFAQDADTIYVNGNVYTVDEAFSNASAFAVKDGEFIYVGTDAGARDECTATWAA